MRKVFLALFAGIIIGVLASAPGHSAAAVMGSTAVSWEEIQAKPSGTGVTKAKQVFKDPTATLDELELHVSTLPVGQSPHPPHKHPDEEIVIIKEGTVEALVKVVGVLRGWMASRKASGTKKQSTMRITVNGQTLELTPTAAQQQALVAEFVKAAATDEK